jgi:MarR family transcriptional regulator, organic hydroperoxide resistance regulator
MDIGNGRRALKSGAPAKGADARPPLTVSRNDLLTDGADGEFRQLVHRLLAFSARLETCRSGFGALLDLTGVQYTALISIAHLEGDDGVGVKTVADHLGLSGSFLTIVTGQLAKRGLVEKSTNPQDRRRVHLRVTDKGRELLEGLAPIQRDVNDLLFQPLDAKRFRALNDILADLIQAADEATALIGYYSQSGVDGARAPKARLRG